MIVDTLANISRYKGIDEALDNAIEYMVNTDLTRAETAKLDNNVTVLWQEYKTVSSEDLSFEAHQKCIDIHYIIRGREIIEYRDISMLECIWEYDEDNDYSLYDGRGSKMRLEENMFCICFPNDAHKTKVLVDNPCWINKVVLKVNSSLCR